MIIGLFDGNNKKKHAENYYYLLSDLLDVSCFGISCVSIERFRKENSY